MSKEISRIDMIRMVYDKVSELENNIYYCELDNENVILDELGNNLKIYDKDNKELKITKCIECSKDYDKDFDGTHKNLVRFYGIAEECSDKKLIIFNTKLKKYIIPRYNFDYKYISKDLFWLRTESKYKNKECISIINSDFEIVAQFASVKYFDVLKYYEGSIGYLYYYIDGSSRKLTINTKTHQLIHYDEYGIDENMNAVATSFTSVPDKGIHFKYRLETKLGVVGNEYDRFYKSEQLRNTNYIYVFEDDKMGVIDTLIGKELIKPEYDLLTYIGYDRFLTKNKQENNIISVHTGKLYNDTEIKSITEHSTIPILIIKFINNNLVLYNIINGEIFNIEDFARQFDCSYNSVYTDIIRIKDTWGFRYITNTLTPITNQSYIQRLNNSSWVKM